MNNSKVLLLTNTLPSDTGGRAEKFETRKRLLQERGWSVTFGHIREPYPGHLPRATDVVKLLWQLQQESIDVINSVSEPPQPHLVGYLLNQLTGIPWLVEFRDPIWDKPGRSPDETMIKLRRRLEGLLVRNATQVVWDNGIQLDDDHFAKTYPGIPTTRWFKLPYIGYEQSRFESAGSSAFDRFTVTYAGSFYQGWIEPYTFLEGFAQLDIPREFKVFGDWTEKYQQAAVEAGVADFVSHHGWVDFDQLIPALKGSDVLLYIGGDDPDNRNNVPSKLYDYIGADTPILAIVDPTFRVAGLIESYDLGLVVPPGDSDGVADALLKLREWEHTSSSVTSEFSREHKMDVLASVLDAVSEGGKYQSDSQQ